MKNKAKIILLIIILFFCLRSCGESTTVQNAESHRQDVMSYDEDGNGTLNLRELQDIFNDVKAENGF